MPKTIKTLFSERTKDEDTTENDSDLLYPKEDDGHPSNIDVSGRQLVESFVEVFYDKYLLKSLVKGHMLFFNPNAQESPDAPDTSLTPMAKT